MNTHPESLNITEDWSEVEAHLRHEKALRKQALRCEQARTLAAFAASAIRLGLIGCLVILAIGAAATAVLFGFSLAAEPEIVEVERVVTVDRYVPFRPTFILAADPLGRRAVAGLMAREQERAESAAAEGDAPVLVNVVVFRNTRFQGGDWDWITVGMRYDSIDSLTPDMQTCWVSRSAGEMPAAESRVKLARKAADGVPELEEITPALAQETDTTVEVLEAAQSLCHFE